MFPAQPDPTGGTTTLHHFEIPGDVYSILDPSTWTIEEMRRWLSAVRVLSFSDRVWLILFIQRNLHPNPKDDREQLLERIKANLRTPRS
jgi:hypothetical protein